MTTETTQALEALYAKPIGDMTSLERCIYDAIRSGYDARENAFEAVEELAALRAENKRLRGLLRDAEPIVRSANFVDTGAIKARIRAALSEGQG